MIRSIRALAVVAALAACGTPAEPLAAQDAADSPAAATLADVGGTLVIVNKGANSASIVDVASAEILATLPTGQGPHEVAITKDGRTAVVTDYGNQSGGNSLTVIDVPGLSVARTIDLGSHTRPHGIAFLPGDEVVAVSTEGSAHVVLVDVEAGTVKSALPTAGNVSHMVAIPASAEHIYTSDIRDGTVTEIGVAEGGVTRKFNVPETPEAIGVTPDGSEVWVGSNNLGLMSVIDTGSGAVDTGVLSGFGFPYRVLFSQDASLVLIPDLRSDELRFVDRASRQVLETLDFPGGGPQGIIFSTDESAIFLAMSAQNRVAVIDVASRNVIGFLPAAGRPDGVAHTSLVVE
ncbi:MAG: YncE family protein [Gemmatimonadota bacterium]